MSLPIFLRLTPLVVSAAAYANSAVTPITTGRCRSSNHVCLAAAPSPSADVGLLTGLDVESAEYYTSELVMNSTDDVQWLLKPGILWQAAMKDANARNMTPDDYLLQIKRALVSFSLSDKVHDREDFYEFLNTIYEDPGRFLLVLGGKSVGKSLVLRDFQSKLALNNRFLPLLVDARSFSGAPLSYGILKGYTEFKDFGSGRLTVSEEDALNLIKSVLEIFDDKITGPTLVILDKLQEVLEISPFRLTDDSKKVISKTFGQIVDFLIKSGEVSEELAVQSFVDLANVQRKHPVLIIDEANKVIGLGEDQKATSAALDNIVKLTKQEKRLDVVMASSEYGYPYLLENNGLNLNDMSAILFAGEIPPKSMWELLVTKKEGNAEEPVIGMGDNLAHLLIASYGGHFLRLKASVSYLQTEREYLSIFRGLNPIAENITEVLDAFPRKGLAYLRQMAECGFAPVVKPKESVVEFIVRSNIGGIVSAMNSKVVGLPRTIWQEDDGGGRSVSGLVPTSESARNLIAIEVTYFEKRLEKERRWSNRMRKIFRK